MCPPNFFSNKKNYNDVLSLTEVVSLEGQHIVWEDCGFTSCTEERQLRIPYEGFPMIILNVKVYRCQEGKFKVRAAEDSLRGIPHDHPQCQGLQVSGGQVQGACLSRLSLIQPIQANFLPILEFNVMACSHSPTPRPIKRLIKSGLKRNMWRCSYCTETDTKTDSHWVLC